MFHYSHQVLHTFVTTTLKNGMNLGEGLVGSSDDREMGVASTGAHDDLTAARSEGVVEGRALSPSALHWLVNLATEKAKQEKKGEVHRGSSLAVHSSLHTQLMSIFFVCV